MNWNLTSNEIWSELGTCGPQLVAVLKKNFENLFTTTLVGCGQALNLSCNVSSLVFVASFGAW